MGFFSPSNKENKKQIRLRVGVLIMNEFYLLKGKLFIYLLLLKLQLFINLLKIFD